MTPPYEPPEGIEVFPRVVQDEPEPEEFDPERMAAWHGESDLPPDEQFNALRKTHGYGCGSLLHMQLAARAADRGNL